MRKVAVAVMLMLVATTSQVVAQTTVPQCTSVTYHNVYGVATPFQLSIMDSTNQVVWWRSFFLGASNDTVTFSLLTDQGGNSISLREGEIYTLKLLLYGIGVCCGAFSTFNITL